MRLTRTRNRCIIYVEDNGPGIQAEDIDRIFERFYTDRPEARISARIPALACRSRRQIAEAHGGSLKAENMVDATTGEIAGRPFHPVAARRDTTHDGNATNIHATAIVLGTPGFLFVGPSGSGKIIAGASPAWRPRKHAGLFAALVADDQVLISSTRRRHHRRRPASIAGLVEIRGAGIVAVEPMSRG